MNMRVHVFVREDFLLQKFKLTLQNISSCTTRTVAELLSALVPVMQLHAEGVLLC